MLQSRTGAALRNLVQGLSLLDLIQRFSTSILFSAITADALRLKVHTKEVLDVLSSSFSIKKK